MKKSRFVKAIAAFTMSAVATAGCISLVACGGHTHNTTKGWQGHNETQHWYICDEDDTAYGHQNHNWGDDDICDDCNYDRSNPNPGPGPDGPGPDGPGPDNPGPGGEQGDDYDAFIAEGNVIYQNRFETDATVDCIGTGEEAPATGIYGTVSGNPVDFTEQNVVSISDGKLNVTDNSDQTTNAYVKVEAVNYKKVHIYGKVTPTLAKVAGKWSFVRVLGAGNKDLIDVRANTDKKIQLYDGAAGTFHGTPVDYASGTEYKIEITLDLVEGTASLKFGGAVIAENQAITGLKGSSFTGVMFITAGSDSRSLAVDDLAIKTAEPETAALKEVLDGELDAYYAKLTATEGTYTPENKTLLDQKYADGVAAIAAAETNEAVVSAYEAAVADLDGVETLSDAALNTYKEEKKTELESAYDAAQYVINKEQFDTTLAAEKAKIDAATSTEKVDEALAAAKTAMNAIKTDAQQIAADKESAENELLAYKGGSVNYSFEGVTDYENKAAYTAAITDGTTNIEAALTQEEIATALANAKGVIDGIKDNATILAEAETAATTQIDEYKATEIAGLSVEGQVKAAAAKEACKGVIADLTTPTAIFNAVNSSKTTIDGIVNGESMTLDEYKSSLKTSLQDYANGEIAKLDATADATLIEAINQAVTDGGTAIDGTTEAPVETNEAALEKFNEAKAAIDKLVADDHLAKYKVEKIAALGSYATAEKEEIHNNAAYSLKIDEAVTAGTTAINAAEVTDTAAVDAAYTEASNAIDGLVAECKTSSVTVTLAESGLEALSVTFGTAPVQPATNPTAEGKKFKGWYANVDCTETYTWETVIYDNVTVYAGWILPDVTVLLKVNDTEWQSVEAYSTDSPADLVLPTPYASGKIFSKWTLEGGAEWIAPESWTENQTVTLHAEFTAKTDADLALEETWTVADTVTSGAITDLNVGGEKLFVVTAPEGSIYIKNGDAQGTKTFGGVEIKGTQYNNAVNIGAVAKDGGDSSDRPIVITARENLKTLKVYVKLAGDNGSDTRAGDTYYVVNDGEVQEVTGIDTELVINDLNAGDVVQVYVTNTKSSGGKLYLGKVEATLSETVTNATVVYHGYEDGDHATPWLSINPVTEPAENPSKEGGSFVGWSTTENNTVADYVFDENAKVAAGATLDLYPVYQTADVTVNFYDYDGTEIKVGIGAISGSPLDEANKPADPVREGYNFIGWYEKTGDAYNEAAYDFTTVLTANSTLNLYANYVVKPACNEHESYLAAQLSEKNGTAYAANEQITDNTLFTMVAGVDLTVKAPDRTHSSSDSNEVGSHSLTTADNVKRTEHEIVKITAKEHITVTLYVDSNKLDSNGMRTADATLKINGTAQGTPIAVGAAKNTIYKITCELQKDDELILNVQGTSGNSFTVYFFGAEADLVV